VAQQVNYYNEIDQYAVKWLKALIEHGLIPNGEVDDRSIHDVKGTDLKGYRQCHFFAGIAGWPRALWLAGVSPDEPLWTGSCPCQSLSCAGKQKGADDERHLWPEFCRLIRECRPPKVFGEQVASKLGLEWLAGIRLDLEACGYAVGAADLPAACVTAPHKRQRLFWVADSECCGCNGKTISICRQEPGKVSLPTRRGTNGFWSNSIAIPCADGKWRRVPGRVDNAMQQRTRPELTRQAEPCSDRKENRVPWPTGQTNSRAERFEIEPALFPLADGIPGRVGLLRGAGNAIVPQVAAEFIKAFLDK
jgi:DNA (cytosine-5)-methyltransferase 1